MAFLKRLFKSDIPQPDDEGLPQKTIDKLARLLRQQKTILLPSDEFELTANSLTEADMQQLNQALRRLGLTEIIVYKTLDRVYISDL